MACNDGMTWFHLDWKYWMDIGHLDLDLRDIYPPTSPLY